jgi:dienelactone hydrolase
MTSPPLLDRRIPETAVRVSNTRQAGTGMVALVFGLIGLIFGIGVGVMHVVKAGISVTAVAGLVSLVAGLVLVGFAFSVLVRSLHGWWRLLAVPAAFLLVQFVLIPITPAVYATHVPPTTVGRTTPAELGLDYTDVEFATADGAKLSGWYLPSSNGAAVALLHGSGSTRSAVLDHAAVLARHGYGVLLYDDRGHGRSAGDAMGFGWWGDLDLAAAVSYLQSRPDVDQARIGVVGLSMGGEQAVNAAASDDRIRVVVAEGVEPRLPADQPAPEPGPQGWTQQAVQSIAIATAAFLTDAPEPIPLRDAVKALAPRPVLLIAARGEIDFIRHLQRAAPATVSTWEMPDTEHTRGLDTHPAEWTARVVSILDATLVAGQG